jgi:hypothetical protein
MSERPMFICEKAATCNYADTDYCEGKTPHEWSTSCDGYVCPVNGNAEIKCVPVKEEK